MTMAEGWQAREKDKFVELGGETYVRVATTPAIDSGVLFESKLVSPGASADGYDVKVTGGMFATVTTTIEATIENKDGSEIITVYPNTDGANPITIGPGQSKIINLYPITNLFIDTTASQTSGVEIALIGY